MDNSAKVLAELRTQTQQGLEAVGAVAEGHAKAITPVDTGRLRSSISHAVADDAAYIGTNVEYGPYVEFGTSRMKGHHMLKRAATEHSAEYAAILKAALKG